ncbi:MAG: helix-turn-helix domain-containing protein [Nitrospinota bacterium]|nr:helix-turn-helix domain-containing protein [Nitrospinota bacterium]
MTVAEKKVVRGRLSALQLAEALGNVSEACRRRGMSRTQFYEYKRRFQTHGLEGLRDLPPVHKSHPMTTPPETVEKILALSSENPMRGCTRLSQQLKFAGVSVSSPVIQKILIKRGLGSRYERLLKLEERASKEKVKLTPAQAAAIEKANPCFRERHVESRRPGEARQINLNGNLHPGMPALLGSQTHIRNLHVDRKRPMNRKTRVPAQ